MLNHLRIASFAALISVCFTSGCNKTTNGAQVSAEEPSATYTVQGVVKILPPAAQPGNNKAIVVLHQSIAKFKDKDGQEVGMMAMPMPFTLAKDVDMTGIEVGSKVEFTFGVFWKAATPTHILAIKKLPDDTQIEFSPDDEG